MLSHILARRNCELVFGKSPTHLDINCSRAQLTLTFSSLTLLKP